MKSLKHGGSMARIRRLVLVGLVSSLGVQAMVWGGQRQFLVILANSPKQYPGPNRDPQGQPAGGLISRQLIHNIYFDADDQNTIGSFAEYWEEISYGDIVISGTTTDWMDLPWAIQPPLVNPGRDSAEGNPPVNDDLEDPALRNSPANFYDLNASAEYEYGAPERFLNALSSSIVDLNGNPNGADDGPDFVTMGSFHFTTDGSPVWKPGERFVDMDGDGRWDALDEASNLMDWDYDGFPDRRGPWIDLNGDGIPNNTDNCVYLTDNNNDGNPDCCPYEPGDIASCPGVRATTALNVCPGTTWTDASGNPFVDCNGNLLPDDVEIAANPLIDRLPLTSDGDTCAEPTPDGIPDECQFFNPTIDCADRPANCDGEEPDPCCQPAVCETLPDFLSREDPPGRCEYDDSDNNGECNLVEPFENFLRRWDPCLRDPDVSPPNILTDRQHWVKVYDPFSLNANTPLQCSSPEYSTTYGDDSYIRDNYPAHLGFCIESFDPCAEDDDCPGRNETCWTGVEELIAQAGGWPIIGSVDPLNKAPNAQCVCAIQWPDNNSFACRDIIIGVSVIPKVCIIGYHTQYDPPDSWEDVIAENGPGNAVVTSTKMRAAPGVDFAAEDTRKWTAEPTWYRQAWEDRYAYPNPDFNPGQPVGPTNPKTITPAPPPWTPIFGAPVDPNELVAVGFTHRMEPFGDADEEEYDPEVNRRYFHANRGGLHGNGTGWLACGNVDQRVVFETGPLGVVGFEQSCNAAILPEEVDGASTPGIFFDGYVEHDDLPSSKYHMAGDQRLGEVTSPYNDSIWGEDRGLHDPSLPVVLDDLIPAAGPYATRVHGNFGRDAGNLLLMELLTWRTTPPFNTGNAWQEAQDWTGSRGVHPYAGPYGVNLGFRDYNLDGLVDQGETRFAGSENYQADSEVGTPNNGVDSFYPFNRTRMMEDAIAILDELVDWDDFVDPVAMARVSCPIDQPQDARLPYQLRADPLTSELALANGISSGIMLLPAGAHAQGDFNLSPQFLPIHNDDNQDTEDMFPQTRDSASEEVINWNLFFHNLVIALDVSGEAVQDEDVLPFTDFQAAFAAHEYMHGWEKFPDLYDYDVYRQPGPLINCPIGRWGIMAQGGLVHPMPILKERPCTEWITPVNLRAVVTPGVDVTITLPPAEFVRDDSYYFLENEDRPGERYYFWSAGSGFDLPRSGGGLPGEGMLMLHTDVGANPEAQTPLQGSGTRFTYKIVQADGLGELDAGPGVDPVCGDAGDPWPGSTGNTTFNFDTNPASRWYAQDSPTGLDIVDIIPDGDGSTRVTFNWTPTNIPSLRFVDPPGGVTVGECLPLQEQDCHYQVRADVIDVYGGTWTQFFYTSEETETPDPDAAKRIGIVSKMLPGKIEISVDWDIDSDPRSSDYVPDGRYFVYADLIPSLGADGTERRFTSPQAGRNNSGTATLVVTAADIDTSTIDTSGGQVQVTHQGTARSETWVVRCIDATAGEWIVNSSLTQPEPADDDADPDPYPHAFTGQTYVAIDGSVTFAIEEGATGSTLGALGDMFSFTTTGITAPSAAVSIIGGQIREDPTAVIDASPLAGLPPLEVSFDARRSRDPNGQTLTYRWDFSDGSSFAFGSQVTHTFTDAETFTVVLRATNPFTSRFGEASVDIEVTNNTPNAVVTAKPSSGQPPLQVQFTGTQSSDKETPEGRLVYQWDFGDGQAANDEGIPGIQTGTEHTYRTKADGTECTPAAPCTFTATLKVTDEGGKQDTDSILIRVGNTNPTPVITQDVIDGHAPLVVTFNAKESTDIEGDSLTVKWMWGDGSAAETHPAATGSTPAADGSVPHTFTLPAGEQVATYNVSAIVCDAEFDGGTGDCLGGAGHWLGVTITVTPAPLPSSDPHAEFTVTPEHPILDEEFTVDASGSYDNPDQGPIALYTWDWGDGEDRGSGVTDTHTYTVPGQYMITLTVADAETPPNTTSAQRIVNIALVNHAPVALIATGPRTAQVGTPLVFDGRLSYDPDGDALGYRWEFFLDGTLDEQLTGSQVTRVFNSEGEYTVKLTVFDGLGLSDSSEPETITITARTDGPTDPDPGPGVPDDDDGGLDDPQDSALQRPTGGAMCGFGMVMSLFASLLGLSAMAIARRRFSV